MRSIAHITVVVADYDDAIAWYTDKLGFLLMEDRSIPEQNKRWVTVAPPDAGASLLLARGEDDQAAFIGNQTGGRVFLFLQTDNFEQDYKLMQQKGVEFTEQPRNEPYGTVVVFKDLCGNLWDLIEYA